MTFKYSFKTKTKHIKQLNKPKQTSFWNKWNKFLTLSRVWIHSQLSVLNPETHSEKEKTHANFRIWTEVKILRSTAYQKWWIECYFLNTASCLQEHSDGTTYCTLNLSGATASFPYQKCDVSWRFQNKTSIKKEEINFQY